MKNTDRKNVNNSNTSENNNSFNSHEIKPNNKKHVIYSTSGGIANKPLLSNGIKNDNKKKQNIIYKNNHSDVIKQIGYVEKIESPESIYGDYILEIKELKKDKREIIYGYLPCNYKFDTDDDIFDRVLLPYYYVEFFRDFNFTARKISFIKLNTKKDFKRLEKNLTEYYDTNDSLYKEFRDILICCADRRCIKPIEIHTLINSISGDNNSYGGIIMLILQYYLDEEIIDESAAHRIINMVFDSASEINFESVFDDRYIEYMSYLLRNFKKKKRKFYFKSHLSRVVGKSSTEEIIELISNKLDKKRDAVLIKDIVEHLNNIQFLMCSDYKEFVTDQQILKLPENDIIDFIKGRLDGEKDLDRKKSLVEQLGDDLLKCHPEFKDFASDQQILKLSEKQIVDFINGSLNRKKDLERIKNLVGKQKDDFLDRYPEFKDFASDQQILKLPEEQIVDFINGSLNRKKDLERIKNLVGKQKDDFLDRYPEFKDFASDQQILKLPEEQIVDFINGSLNRKKDLERIKSLVEQLGEQLGDDFLKNHPEFKVYATDQQILKLPEEQIVDFINGSLSRKKDLERIKSLVGKQKDDFLDRYPEFKDFASDQQILKLPENDIVDFINGSLDRNKDSERIKSLVRKLEDDILIRYPEFKDFASDQQILKLPNKEDIIDRISDILNSLNRQERCYWNRQGISYNKGRIGKLVKKLDNDILLTHPEFEDFASDIQRYTLSREQTRKQRIQWITQEGPKITKIIKTRKIEHFVHFTQVSNIDSIIQNGLLPKNELEENGIAYSQSDEKRLDRRDGEEPICLSVSFPNCQMLYAKQNQNITVKWCVFLVDPIIVGKCYCQYFSFNAASARFLSDFNEGIKHDKSDDFMKIFSKEVYTDKAIYPRDFPTDSKEFDKYATSFQAEIQCFDKIELDYIKKCVFLDKETCEEYKDRLEGVGIDVTVDDKWFFSYGPYQK